MAINGLAFQSSSVATTAYVDASHGLSLITPTSIANSGGSASVSGGAVSFSGVTSISLNTVFTSTYDNYRVVVILTNSSFGNHLMRLRASGSDNSSTSYKIVCYRQRSDATTAFVANGTSATAWTWASDVDTIGASLDIFAPQLTRRTQLAAVVSSDYAPGSFDVISVAGSTTVTTSYDGFTIYGAAGTITGTLRVYGYKN